VALEGLPGQARAVALLEAALRTGTVAHAYLFVGPSGVGRAALARRFAAVLLCDAGGQEACGRCRSCRAFNASNHPDYREVGVPEGKQDVPIALIRSLEREAALKPVLAQRRVFVVRDAERMSLEAANCFLKTLEEPPGSCCFILVATSLWDIPQTVVSRCGVVRFVGLRPERVEEELRREGLDEDDARWLARRSWGSPGRARAFRDAGMLELNRELTAELLALGPGEGLRLTDWLSEASSGQSRAERRAFLQELLECVAVFYRDLAVAAVAGDEAELFNRGIGDKIERLAASMPVDTIVECADRALEAIERVGANANSTLTLDDLFLHLGRAAAGAAAVGGPSGDKTEG